MVHVCESQLQILIFHKALQAGCSIKAWPLPVLSKATIYEKLETANQPWQSREEAQRGRYKQLLEDRAQPTPGEKARKASGEMHHLQEGHKNVGTQLNRQGKHKCKSPEAWEPWLGVEVGERTEEG